MASGCEASNVLRVTGLSNVNIIVHRGTRQIGGSCVEIASGVDRVLLDLGLPLSTADDEPAIAGQSVSSLLASGVLPDIGGVYTGSDLGVSAVVMSHVHQDHLGLAHFVDPAIPVYATQGTWALHDVLQVFVPNPMPIATRRLLPKRQPVRFGSLTVTALPVDHSAPDAVAILVEADGKRLLYSGDLRAHGRKAYLYDNLIRDLTGRINVLLLEGTTLGRPNSEPVTEESLESNLLALLAQQRHFALIFCSAQNLDRLVTIYRAVKRTRKLMVIDLYTAYTLDQLRCLSNHLPQWSWPEVRVVPWGYQQQRLAEAGKTAFLEETKRHWIGWEAMKARKHDVVLLMRANRKIADFERELGEDVSEMQVIWSMWDGYWDQDQYVRPFCEKHGIVRAKLHTSGHASLTDLQRIAEGLKPELVVPIHTEHAGDFAQYFAGVRVIADGEILDV